MLALLSPSKTQNFDAGWKVPEVSQPALLDESLILVKQLQGYGEERLGELMKISPKLAALNHERFQLFQTPFTNDNAKPAVLAFRGDVYDGLDAENLTQNDLKSAQQRIRILSGLYGVLKPLDLIQPYRLEMGTKLKNKRGKDLYAFWGDELTDLLNNEIAETKAKALVNLASNEYFSAINAKNLNAPLITVHFKDWSGGKYKVVGLFAKKARGMMARYISTQKIDAPQGIKKWTEEGYRFSEGDSTETDYVFTRKK